MHLMLAALHRGGGPALVADPTVKGGGTFRLELAESFVAPKVLAAWLGQTNQWILQDRKVSLEHVVRGLESRALDAQNFQVPDPYPGPDTTLDAIRIDGVSCYPCDGTHVERTSKVGGVQIVQAHAAGAGFVVVGRVI